MKRGIESIPADEFTIHNSVGACLTSSGKLLILPTGTVDELVLYDPASKLTRQIKTSQSLGDAGYINGVLASNGKIYAVTTKTFGNLQKGFFVVACAELESLDNTYRTDVFTAFTDPQLFLDGFYKCRTFCLQLLQFRNFFEIEIRAKSLI